jgi:hypothetical protein
VLLALEQPAGSIAVAKEEEEEEAGLPSRHGCSLGCRLGRENRPLKSHKAQPEQENTSGVVLSARPAA